MTGRKTRHSGGRRPAVDECIEAWWRIADTPAGRLLPDSPHGEPGDTTRLCGAFDLYCWRLVCEAFSACRSRGIPPTRLSRLVAHIQCGGAFKDFQVYDPIQIDPADPKGWRSKKREITEVDRIGIDEAWLARAAYAKFRRVLLGIITDSEPYIPPARGPA